jgi:hypothetical protein
VDDNVPQQEVFFQVWYNSEWNMIHVNASKLKGRTGSLRLFDMEGRLVFEKKVEVISWRVCDGRDTDECGGEWGLSCQSYY